MATDLMKLILDLTLRFTTFCSVNMQRMPSGLTRGLATLPQGGSSSLRWSEIRMEDPQEDPLAVHCFCVCSRRIDDPDTDLEPSNLSPT